MILRFSCTVKHDFLNQIFLMLEFLGIVGMLGTFHYPLMIINNMEASGNPLLVKQQERPPHKSKFISLA